MTTSTASAGPLPHAEDRAGPWVGRAWDPAEGGPCVVTLRGEDVVDVTAPDIATVRDLLELDDPPGRLAAADGRRLGSLAELAAAALAGDTTRPRLVAPCDLQALKACGVTFARSMVERVIEERAAGDPAKAEAIRGRIAGLIGASLARHPARQRAGCGGEGGADRRGAVVAVPRGRDRAGRRGLHQGPADVGGRLGRHRRAASGLALEQPRARGGARGVEPRPHRRRDASATTSTCATSRAARRSCSARPRTTTPPARSGRSSGFSTRASRSTTCARPS